MSVMTNAADKYTYTKLVFTIVGFIDILFIDLTYKSYFTLKLDSITY